MDIRIGKAGIDIPVNVDALSAPVIEYVIRYGLTQMLNDAHSAVTRDTHPDDDQRRDECLALANKKLDALLSGNVRAQSREGDPVKAEAMRLATMTVRAAFRNARMKIPDAKGLKARAEGYLAKHPELLDQAREMIAGRKGLADDVDLTDIVV